MKYRNETNELINGRELSNVGSVIFCIFAVSVLSISYLLLDFLVTILKL